MKIKFDMEESHFIRSTVLSARVNSDEWQLWDGVMKKLDQVIDFPDGFTATEEE